MSQGTDGLYRVDTVTAEASVVGFADLDLYGGDLTFDADDRLWVWTNAIPLEGLYEMNPDTAATELVDAEPGTRLAGLAAVGHGSSMRGSSPPGNLLLEIDSVVGVRGVEHPLTLDGQPFDHDRGDLDSPFCSRDSACDDGDPCTTDRCTPGGCRNLFEDSTCDGYDDDCDGLVDEDFPQETTNCGVGACAAAGILQCTNGLVEDTCAPGTPAPDDSMCNGEDDDCDGLVDEDADWDGDGIPDCSDNCPDEPNPNQVDRDLDGSGDACDFCPDDPSNDADGDGVCGDADCAPDAYGSSTLPGSASGLRVSADRATLSWDGAAQAHVYSVYRSHTAAGLPFSPSFACRQSAITSRTAQETENPPPGALWSYLVAGENGCGEGTLGPYSDGDRPSPSSPCPTTRGVDTDLDGIEDADDVCPSVADPSQPDQDRDWLGDACDICPTTENPSQRDSDEDGDGDACDVCPEDPTNDEDSDGVCGGADNCPAVANPEQADGDLDGLGNACDACPDDPANDPDGDGTCEGSDNCPNLPNPDQADSDQDSLGDACDSCPADAANDEDADGICGDVDNCPSTSNPSQNDADADLLGDVCDFCPNDAANDVDADGICGDVDNCPADANADQADGDSDQVGDSCDNCLAVSNPDQTNSDGDQFGDACDNCPDRVNHDQSDVDVDGFGDTCDNCPDAFNPDQINSDSDSYGDACDNCPFVHNPNQKDRDGDGIGDACDPTP
jgi:hypothetical protein